MPTKKAKYEYTWPQQALTEFAAWDRLSGTDFITRQLPESSDELEVDSRWPAFFPSPISLVTTSADGMSALERVVGATIVNRFPLVAAVSICRVPLSSRHYQRNLFCEILERGGNVVLQFLSPGPKLDAALGAIEAIDDARVTQRIHKSGLSTRSAVTSNAPIFADAYLAYECRLVSVGENAPQSKPWADVGSHRLYFLHITAIQLRQDIAKGISRVYWRSLPEFSPKIPFSNPQTSLSPSSSGFIKQFTPHYYFPANSTVAFAYDRLHENMALKLLPDAVSAQMELDNFRSGYPCFYPSSLGMITSWSNEGKPNLMPCGSTMMVSRHPLVIGACLTSSHVNDRTKPRASLEMIRSKRGFGCGVPFIEEHLLRAIYFAGNTSYDADSSKVAHCGLNVLDREIAPLLTDLPIHFECRLIGEEVMGSHTMLLGEVTRVFVRGDVSPDSPLRWTPWASIVSNEG